MRSSPKPASSCPPCREHIFSPRLTALPLLSIVLRRFYFPQYFAESSRLAPAIPDDFNQSLETDKGLAVQIMCIVDEQGDRSLPLSDKVTQSAFPSFRLSGNLEILLDRQIVK